MCCHPVCSIDEIYADVTKDLNQILDQDQFSVTKDSNYISIDDYGHLEINEYGLKIIHLNIQSLPSKIDDLRIILHKLANQDIIIDSEIDF